MYPPSSHLVVLLAKPHPKHNPCQSIHTHSLLPKLHSWFSSPVVVFNTIKLCCFSSSLQHHVSTPTSVSFIFLSRPFIHSPHSLMTIHSSTSLSPFHSSTHHAFTHSFIHHLAHAHSFILTCTPSQPASQPAFILTSLGGFRHYSFSDVLLSGWFGVFVDFNGG